jgi:hypothetical protein
MPFTTRAPMSRAVLVLGCQAYSGTCLRGPKYNHNTNMNYILTVSLLQTTEELLQLRM